MEMETVPPPSLIVRIRLFLVDGDDDMLCESSKIRRTIDRAVIARSRLMLSQVTIVMLLVIYIDLMEGRSRCYGYDSFRPSCKWQRSASGCSGGGGGLAIDSQESEAQAPWASA